jgi:hypothetical protein
MATALCAQSKTSNWKSYKTKAYEDDQRFPTEPCEGDGAGLPKVSFPLVGTINCL